MNGPQTPPPLDPLGIPAKPARALRLIVLHCSATASGIRLRGPQGEADPARVIDGWHLRRGFVRTQAARQRFNPSLESIGYHYVVDVDGAIHTGRHLDEVGAHVRGHNSDSIGICLVGGAEPVARYSLPQWDSLAHLVLTLGQRLDIRVQAGSSVRSGVCGHRDLSPDTNRDGAVQPQEWLKTCPGFDVATWLTRGLRPHPQHLTVPK